MRVRVHVARVGTHRIALANRARRYPKTIVWTSMPSRAPNLAVIA